MELPLILTGVVGIFQIYVFFFRKQMFFSLIFIFFLQCIIFTEQFDYRNTAYYRKDSKHKATGYYDIDEKHSYGDYSAY